MRFLLFPKVVVNIVAWYKKPAKSTKRLSNQTEEGNHLDPYIYISTIRVSLSETLLSERWMKLVEDNAGICSYIATLQQISSLIQLLSGYDDASNIMGYDVARPVVRLTSNSVPYFLMNL
ncbi:unnamed protein product [Heterobilharzia americana]|nr:unnamed protein product [Heterobilharzia americana]